jgi:hypothetical protein
VSNPVYFLPDAPPPQPLVPAALTPVDLAWHVEKSAGSDGDLAGSETAVSIDFRLRSGEKASQFVALAGDFRGTRPEGAFLTFDADASRPMRVSAQLRYPGGGAEERRWGRSFYIDAGARRVSIPIEEMIPVDGLPGTTAPPVETARSVIFVVDLTNASPGSSGTFRIANAAIGR